MATGLILGGSTEGSDSPADRRAAQKIPLETPPFLLHTFVDIYIQIDTDVYI